MWETLEIVSILIATILTILSKVKWKDLSTLHKATCFSGIVAALVLAFVSYRKVQKEELIERINAKYGDIGDLFGATIPKVQVGRNGAIIILESGVFSLRDLGKKYNDLLRVYILDGKLNVDIVVRDPNNNTIAVIDKNVWTKYEDDYEYNNDGQAFEVVTKGDRDVYFQVDLKNGIAHVTGLLINRNGFGVHIYETEDLEYNTEIAVMEVNKGFKPRNAGKRIFKYPRAKNIGKREVYRQSTPHP